jgi:hypothetical protein
MFKKAITLAIGMAFTMNLATTAMAVEPHGDGGGHRHHKPQVQQLSARLHVVPNCTLTKDEDRGDRADFKFREIDAIGSDADDAGNPESTSLKYDCSKWTHPRLTLNDGHRGGDGHQVADRGRRGDDSKNFYLVNHDDKIAFNIWSVGYGHHEFENSDNPHGDGALSLLSNSHGKIDLNAKLARYHGSLEPGHYSDVVTATLFF